MQHEQKQIGGRAHALTRKYNSLYLVLMMDDARRHLLSVPIKSTGGGSKPSDSEALCGISLFRKDRSFSSR
jgi:hypothetical protein